jgi:predicted nucleic acid-binding protein
MERPPIASPERDVVDQDLDSALALIAAKIGADAKQALADSVVLATARQIEATLWTQDADFEGLPDVKFRAKRSAARPG